MEESFCAKQVVHRHRLSYKAEEYSMVVILRMNRAFHGGYPSLSRQCYG